jgi:proteic killer suppression protein
MIISFRHRGLKRFYEKDDRKGINSKYADKIARILARLEIAIEPEDMNLPGYRLHKLSGNYSNFWSVKVNANWRIIFRFERQDVADVELIDYH